MVISLVRCLGLLAVSRLYVMGACRLPPLGPAIWFSTFATERIFDAFKWLEWFAPALWAPSFGLVGIA